MNASSGRAVSISLKNEMNEIHKPDCQGSFLMPGPNFVFSLIGFPYFEL